MKKGCFIFLLYAGHILCAQSVKENLAQGIAQMEADPPFRHAIIGLCVVDCKTGKPVYEHNAQTGLAPASTQKLFTSCAAFDLLGKEYKYSTEIEYRYVKGNTAMGYLFVKSSGDPSFGSSRFLSSKPDKVFDSMVAALRGKKISAVSLKSQWSDHFDNSIPGGWIWEDIGNYYGAGAQGFNWMENQYDLILKSGSRPGDTVHIVGTKPAEAKEFIGAHLTSAAKSTGDNTVVYLPYGDDVPFIEGTIPVNENAFVVSAAVSNPFNIFSLQLENRLKKEGIEVAEIYNRHPVPFSVIPDSMMLSVVLCKHLSPPLDSLNYWFLKKSINLYGEALIKTMALEKTGFGSTGKGVELLKDFWDQHGIEKPSLHICDGSGLSPQNRVTTDALVKALQYAKTRPWFSSFYYALPQYNGMKMKSGSINGARAFAGYQQAKDGKEYSFAIIINNYDGAPAEVIKKMYALLNNLK